MANFKEMRELAGWTQQRAANATGMDRSTLSMIESGETEVTSQAAAKIRRVLLRAMIKRAARINRILNDAASERERAGADPPRSGHGNITRSES